MKRFLIVTAVLASTLAACTGSREATNPVLLVVGYNSGEEGRVALIKDRFGEVGTVDPDNQLEFLPGSVRNLPAPAVAYDVTNRDISRDRLVVLSREEAVAGRATGHLNLFSLRNIDPDNPTAFGPVPGGEYTISNTPGDVEVVPDTLLNPEFCPASVQVTQTGNFAAVLNEPSLCGSRSQPSIDIFELGKGRLRLLQRLTTSGSEGAGGFFLAAGGDIYLSQSPTQDLLYYAVSVPGGLRLEQATLPRPNDFGPDDRVAVAAVANVRARAAREGDLVDLSRAGGDERLVVLFESAVASVEGFADGSAEDDVVPVRTSPDNAFVIRDDSGETDATLLMSTPTVQRFSYVPVGDDPEIRSARVNAVDAVVGPNSGFVYFIASGQVAIFDLGSYDEGERLRNPRAVAVPQLGDPSFVTWTQAAPPLPVAASD